MGFEEIVEEIRLRVEERNRLEDEAAACDPLPAGARRLRWYTLKDGQIISCPAPPPDHLLAQPLKR